MKPTLAIANKTYSSWSFRQWILMRHFGIAFDEIVIPMAQKYPRGNVALFPSRQMSIVARWRNRRMGFARDYRICRRTPSTHSDLPRPRAARAQARSLAADSEQSFIGLRGLLPMNMRREVKERELTPEASADIARLEQAFGQARREFGKAGAFLFGDFSAADAMFAPVVNPSACV